MSRIARMVKAFRRWQIGRTVARLNASAVCFGMSPLTPAQWLRACVRMQRAARRMGSTVQEVQDAFTKLGEALRRQPEGEPRLE